ncbi:DUF58 domain-containing protein [Halieaceae bacterium IMCC14734]|uniref:DUF58 domain-containing protein n=1 Tax=Candidatus Litorirhabdus singularis TaxID=2518993 RepID=A0ABT3TBR6_9GAMM|nr:DUF58 domain-containing protein [Candidatus Litorirhabdus singularis]MCX2979717.1 DUF58 domain-containing protein [Candidatus Litorirhabdus singularis]
MSQPIDDSKDSSNVYVDVTALSRLHQEAHGFSFLPRQPLNSLLSGRKRSRLRGRGLDFEELRHYRPGDDIRSMDWRVTNRTGKPHVRVYTEERDRPVLLVIDQRLSMFFGSQQKMKSVSAAELGAVAGWRVLEQGDRVGAILFNDSQILQIKPSRSRRNLLSILSQLASMNQQLAVSSKVPPNPAQLENAIAVAERMVGHDYLVVIVSDFDGWNQASLAAVKRISQHNDLIAGFIYDPLEQDISSASDLVVSDGRYQLQLEPHKKSLGERFEATFQNRVENLQLELRRHGMPVIPLNTVTSVFSQLRQHLGQR